MGSPLLLDDDEFDWEAAVREIDVASQGIILNSNQAGPSGRLSESTSKGQSAVSEPKTGIGARQTTLERFIRSHATTDRSQSTSESTTGKKDTTLDEQNGPCAKIDLEAAQTWIYPVNVPLRDYQFNITRTALFSNTLVALPTGLGKTLIAAVVMYNYFRWFPEGKIVFAAPSRPLVLQQIEACHNVVGIPQEWTIDMTGQISPSKRANFWKVKRVFFVTPQVLEKDIQAGTCLVKQLVCLVIDEAHRALGNYAYCVTVRELMAVPVQLRILALTATPGSKQGSIQNVIDNLHISTLEYRNEDDHDVRSYVHNRKLELIEVPMGNDAVEANNLLLECIRPFAGRLCAIGVLNRRDFATLSPCDLLSSRDKFRQAPPMSLPQTKYGEIEGYFGALITLYHIRKLLSSHGIRPAYEMLEEKMQQGSFARSMGRNESMWKAKVLMQKTLSHGVPTPKLMKMMEVLLDHFRQNDPKDSRVIIFSNFRGSVKDIMDSLQSIGHLVKATQFIGQTSGKSSKGQSQKVQQEVLQKFRSGGYNVIVATSIGEEGLDIMEVDLVICFDANVSPLRMIQRMGRTGRKHDGRVVVLACEGSEIKGYMRKQANSKAVRKHMHNGGTNAFNFHLSPRMVPHVCKPEVQFVELSIKEFIPRGKKIKVSPKSTSKFLNEISNGEAGTIAKYFGHSSEGIWRPCLIAFPHFQAFPSRVHKVRHSERTTYMLIDTISQLQGLSAVRANATVQVQSSSSQFKQAVTSGHSDDSKTDACSDVDTVLPPEVVNLEQQLTEAKREDDVPLNSDIWNHEIPLPLICRNDNDPSSTDTQINPFLHCFLFGSEFVSLDPFGKVLISLAPTLPSTRNSHDLKITAASKDSFDLHNSNIYQDQQIHEEKVEIEKEILKEDPMQVVPYVDSPDIIENQVEAELGCDLQDLDLSPRLTNFLVKGVVPESPVVRCHDDKLGSFICLHSPDTSKMGISQIPKKLNLEMHEKVQVREGGCQSNLQKESFVESTTVMGSHTPLVLQTNNRSTENWLLSSEETKSVKIEHKLKRLCKHGEVTKKLPCEALNDEFSNIRSNLCRSMTRSSLSSTKHIEGRQKAQVGIRCFVEEEAEVSADGDVSEDEEEDKSEELYEDSFIDDRVSPSLDLQAEAASVDMMAIYRRSLLTQSPYPTNSVASTGDHSRSSKSTECGNFSSEKNNPLLTPSTSNFATLSMGKNSVSCLLDMKRNSLSMVGVTSGLPCEDQNKTRHRKRKLFVEMEPMPEFSCQEGHLVQSKASKGASSQCQDQNNELTNNEFFDDQFYEGLDLDAVEEQATELFRTKLSRVKTRREISSMSPESKEAVGLAFVGSPSFDLGI